MPFYYDNTSKKCLGFWGEGTTPPPNSTATDLVPEDGRQLWINNKWKLQLDFTQNEALVRIEEKYNAMLEAGMPYGGKILQLREKDQSVLHVMGNEARWAKLGNQPWIPNFKWRMKDDTSISIPTADAMIALAEAAKSEVYRLKLVKWDHDDAIKAAESTEEVLAHNFEEGWVI
jgi:hypothetical protein